MKSRDGEVALPAAQAKRSTRLHIQAAKWRTWKESMLGYSFLAPSLVLFGLSLFSPLIQYVYVSSDITDPRGRVAAYVVLDNFTALLSSDMLWNILKVTALLTLFTVPTGSILRAISAAFPHIRWPGM